MARHSGHRVRAAVAAAVLALSGMGAMATRAAAAAALQVCPSGCTYSTINAALAAAPDGGKIQVAAGTYVEGHAFLDGSFPNISIGKNITIVGAGAGVTIIEPMYPAYPVIGVGGNLTSPGFNISFVTITGSTAGGGISLAPNGVGFSTTVIVSNSEITGNSGGPGIDASGFGANLTVNATSIHDNHSVGDYGGAVKVGGYGGGEGSVAVIKNSTITNNTAFWGGGLFVGNGPTSSLTVSNSTISGNVASTAGTPGWTPAGGGVTSYGGTLVLKNDVLAGNAADNGLGGGVYSIATLPSGSPANTVSISGTTFTNNIAADGGGVFLDTGSVLTSNKNNTFNGNSIRQCVC